MAKKRKNPDPYEAINKKLNMIVALLLAKSGFQRKEVAKILDVSEKTLGRMFAGNWNKIKKDENG